MWLSSTVKMDTWIELLNSTQPLKVWVDKWSCRVLPMAKLLWFIVPSSFSQTHCDARQRWGILVPLTCCQHPGLCPQWAVPGRPQAWSWKTSPLVYPVSALIPAAFGASLWLPVCFVLACLKPASLCVHSPPPEAPALASRHPPHSFPEHAGLFLQASRLQ